jgi:phage baseplate assembly protein W
MTSLAPQLPLAEDDSTQYAMLTDYSKLALQNLKMLILTIPGERIMDPEFGVGILQYLFENNDRTIRTKISTRINQQVDKYLPYLDILEIKYHSSVEDPTVSEHYLGVRIVFNIIPVGIVMALSLSIDGSDITASGEIVTYS